MKKECTCKKLVKDDKVLLITECDICKKDRRKEFKLDIELIDKLIELKKLSNPVPEYKKGGSIIENNNEKEHIISVDGKRYIVTSKLRNVDGTTRLTLKDSLSVEEHINELNKIMYKQGICRK